MCPLVIHTNLNYTVLVYTVENVITLQSVNEGIVVFARSCYTTLAKITTKTNIKITHIKGGF